MAVSNESVTIVDLAGTVAVSTAGSPVSTVGQLAMGSDGTNGRFLLTDTSGRLVVIGQGVAGTPAGGVVSIQGVSGGQPIPVTGSISATNPSVSTTGSAVPASATLIGATDGTNLVALRIKAASTAAVATDPSLVVALSPNSPIPTGANVIGAVTQGAAGTAAAGWFVKLTDGTNTAPTADVAARSSFHRITDGTNTAAVKASTTAPVAADPALVVTMSPNSPSFADTTATGTLNALNAAATVVLAGQTSVGFQLSAGTLIGTIVAEVSFDGGTTWVATLFADPTTGINNTSIIFASANPATARSIVGSGGASNARVRVSAFTSGTATCNIRASTVNDPNVLFASQTGAIAPPQAAQIGGTDGTNLIPLRVKGASTAAAAADPSVVVAFSPNSPLPAGTNTIGNVNLNGLAFPFLVVGNLAAGAATAGNPVLIGGSDGSNIRYLRTGTDGSLYVSMSPTRPADPVVTGALGALNAAVTISTAGNYTIGGTITGTWVGTLTAESTVDGTNWFTCRTANKSTNDIIQTFTANDSFEFYSIAGSTGARLRMSAYTSGSATVTLAGTTVATDAFLNYSGPDADAAPPLRHVSIASLSSDGTLHSPRNSNAAPDGTEWALITRNIPSGIQAIGGDAANSASPDPNAAVTSTAGLLFDSSNNLEVRGQILTDEGSFRDDFSGANIATNLTGTATFTNGSTAVTGVGTTFLTSGTVTTDRYIKVASQADNFYARIAEITSETTLTLVTPYAGATAAGTTAAVTYWAPTAVATGAVTVSTSEALLASGTGATGSIFLTHTGDYLPYVATFRVRISQRIANQTAVFGLQDIAGNPQQQAVVVMDGLVNTTVKFRTSFSSAAADTQETVVTLPVGATTAATNRYEIDLTQDSAALLINGVLVAAHNNHLPGPYTNLVIVMGLTNTAAVTATTLGVDSVFFSNVNNVQIDNVFTGTPMVMGGQDSAGTTRPIGSVLDRAMMTAGSQTGVPVVGQSTGVARILSLSRLGQATPGYQSLLAMDPIEGTTINSWLWTQSATTMTIAQTGGVLTLNNASSVATTTNAIVTTNRQFPIVNQASIQCSFRAAVSQTTNAVEELGFGAPTGTTAIINNGAFFRISASGTVRVVTSYNGTENVSGVLATLTATSYYLFIVVMEDNGARFIIEDSGGIPLVDTGLALGLTTPDKAAVTHIPAFARVYTTAAAGTAPQIKISSFQAWQLGVNNSKPWSDQLSQAGRSANINPTTFVQTAQLAAGAAPTTTTPTNTTVAYTTLGGEFVLNGTATSENLLGIFGFTVPSPYTFVLTDVIFPPPVVTGALGATVNIQEWCLMVGSSAVPNAATGQRYTIGLYSAAQSAPVGTVYNGQTINIRYQTPITVLPGQVLMVLMKMISGAASGVYRGSILLNGYYE